MEDHSCGGTRTNAAAISYATAYGSLQHRGCHRLHMAVLRLASSWVYV